MSDPSPSHDQTRAPSRKARRNPPWLLKVAQDEWSAVFIDVDGSVYRKHYDEYGGGIGRTKILWPMSLQYRRQAADVIEDAWVAHDERAAKRQEDARIELDAAAQVLNGLNLGIEPSALAFLSAEARSQEIVSTAFGLPIGDGETLIVQARDGQAQWFRQTVGNRESLTPEQARELLQERTRVQTHEPAPVRISSSHGKDRGISR